MYLEQIKNEITITQINREKIIPIGKPLYLKRVCRNRPMDMQRLRLTQDAAPPLAVAAPAMNQSNPCLTPCQARVQPWPRKCRSRSKKSFRHRGLLVACARLYLEQIQMRSRSKKVTSPNPAIWLILCRNALWECLMRIHPSIRTRIETHSQLQSPVRRAGHVDVHHAPASHHCISHPMASQQM